MGMIRGHRAGPSVGPVLATVALLVIGSLAPPHLQAQEGQMIITRPVPSRPATRQGVPAPPFAVKTAPPINVSPAETVRTVVGLGVPDALVLSDSEAAAMSTGAGLSIQGHVRTLGGQVGGVTTGGGRGTSGIGQGLGPSSSQPLGGVAGAVQRSTGGLGRTISNAVAPR